MTVIKRISIELDRLGRPQIVDAVQGDSAREVEVELWSGGAPWMVPEDVEIVVKYCNARGVGGIYDTLEDGRKAWRVQGNVVRVEIVPQACAIPGNTKLQIMMRQDARQISTFEIILAVARGVQANNIKDDYIHVNQGHGKDDEKAVPRYWEPAIAAAVSKVREIQNTAGKDVVNFIHFSDMHYTSSEKYTGNIGLVAARLMESLNIPLIALTGDITEHGAAKTSAVLDAGVAEALDTLKPIGLENLLYCKGNHDGAWGPKADYGMNYAMIQHPRKLWNSIFRWQAADFRRVFSEDGSYYFLDHIPQKVRYIVLNSHWADYSDIGNEDYNAQATEYNTQKNINYGDDQAQWLAKTALDFEGEDGWTVVVFTHAPLWNKCNGVARSYMNVQYAGVNNAARIREILIGFCNKAPNVTYKTGGTVDYSAVGANCTVAGVFCGHCHTDLICKQDDNTPSGYTAQLPFPVISITSAAHSNTSYEEGFGVPVTTRIQGTATETAMDVVSINKANKTISLTRVGAGGDRATFYGAEDIQTHTVRVTGTGLSPVSTMIRDGETAMITLVPLSGYALPTGVTITGSYDSYSIDGGVLTIRNVGSDLSVTANGTRVDTEAELAGISAVYSGGSVEIGTPLTSLQGIAVRAHYSDGTSHEVTGYTLSGSVSNVGNNAITVSYQGKTASFTVVGQASGTGVPDVVLNANVFDKTASGFQDNMRISSSAASSGYISAEPTQFMTNFIRIDNGQYINISVPGSGTTAGTTVGKYYLCYDENKELISVGSGWAGGTWGGYVLENHLFKQRILVEGIKYIRLGPYKTDASGITLDNCDIRITTV